VSGYRGQLLDDGQRVTVSHGDVVDVLRHVTQGRETAVIGELIRSDPGKLGTVVGVV
jgi:phage tail protein X